MKELSIIVPFYNEARTLGQLVKELDQIPSKTFAMCLFVDDGSNDNSQAVLKSALEKVNFDFEILSKTNGGKASAVKFASSRLSTSHLLILDADLELETSDIVRLWEVVLSGKSDIVFGYRHFLAQSSFTYRFSKGNRFISNIYGILFNEVITDIMCGLKLLPTSHLLECPFNFSRFAIEVEIPLQLWLKRLRPFEVQVGYTPRSREDGKVIGILDAFQVIFDMLFFRIRMSGRRLS